MADRLHPSELLSKKEVGVGWGAAGVLHAPDSRCCLVNMGSKGNKQGPWLCLVKSRLQGAYALVRKELVTEHHPYRCSIKLSTF
eukprot:scaffold103797_cov22-Tisochrysis_lutea.AAC.1